MLDFGQFINETKESDIREFVREVYEELNIDAFNRVSDKFNLKKRQITKKQTEEIKDIYNRLLSLTTEIIVDNMGIFREYDNFRLGEQVIDEKGEKYTIDKFGENDNFYDQDKQKFINLDKVKKYGSDI